MANNDEDEATRIENLLNKTFEEGIIWAQRYDYETFKQRIDGLMTASNACKISFENWFDNHEDDEKISLDTIIDKAKEIKAQYRQYEEMFKIPLFIPENSESKHWISIFDYVKIRSFELEDDVIENMDESLKPIFNDKDKATIRINESIKCYSIVSDIIQLGMYISNKEKERIVLEKLSQNLSWKVYINENYHRLRRLLKGFLNPKFNFTNLHTNLFKQYLEYKRNKKPFEESEITESLLPHNINYTKVIECESVLKKFDLIFENNQYKIGEFKKAITDIQDNLLAEYKEQYDSLKSDTETFKIPHDLKISNLFGSQINTYKKGLVDKLRNQTITFIISDISKKNNELSESELLETVNTLKILRVILLKLVLFEKYKIEYIMLMKNIDHDHSDFFRKKLKIINEFYHENIRRTLQIRDTPNQEGLTVQQQIDDLRLSLSWPRNDIEGFDAEKSSLTELIKLMKDSNFQINTQNMEMSTEMQMLQLIKIENPVLNINNSKQTRNSPVDVGTNLIARVIQSKQSKEILKSSHQKWAESRIQECIKWLQSYNIVMFKDKATKFVQFVNDKYQNVSKNILNWSFNSRSSGLTEKVLMEKYNQKLFEPPMFVQYNRKWYNIWQYMLDEYQFTIPANINDYIPFSENNNTLYELLTVLDEKYIEFMDLIKLGNNVSVLNGFLKEMENYETLIQLNSSAYIFESMDRTLTSTSFVLLLNETIHFFADHNQKIEGKDLQKILDIITIFTETDIDNLKKCIDEFSEIENINQDISDIKKMKNPRYNAIEEFKILFNKIMSFEKSNYALKSTNVLADKYRTNLISILTKKKDVNDKQHSIVDNVYIRLLKHCIVRALLFQMNLYNYVLFHCKEKSINCKQLLTNLRIIQDIYNQIVSKENDVFNSTQQSDHYVIRQLIRDLFVKDVEFKRMMTNTESNPVVHNIENITKLVQYLEIESDALNDLLRSEQGAYYMAMVKDIKDAYELTESIRRIICHATSFK